MMNNSPVDPYPLNNTTSLSTKVLHNSSGQLAPAYRTNRNFCSGFNPIFLFFSESNSRISCSSKLGTVNKIVIPFLTCILRNNSSGFGGNVTQSGSAYVHPVRIVHTIALKVNR
jgi:hypothetical protein